MRFAIVGSNFIAEWFVAAAKECENLLLQTAYSRSREQALSNAEKWGTRSACWDWEELRRDESVDAVYIATPNALHYAQVESMLLSKHVLCKSPSCPAKRSWSRCWPGRERGLLLLSHAAAHLPPWILCGGAAQAGDFALRRVPLCPVFLRYTRFQQGIIENAFDPPCPTA